MAEWLLTYRDDNTTEHWGLVSQMWLVKFTNALIDQGAEIVPVAPAAAYLIVMERHPESRMPRKFYEVNLPNKEQA